MSIIEQPPGAEVGSVRTYRGRKLEDLVPMIRAELGPDAVIVREREGLMGGVGGFFAQRCVEVDVLPGGPRIDVYDEDEGELDLAALLKREAAAAGPATGPGAYGAASFAASLAQATTEGAGVTADDPVKVEPEADPTPEPETTPESVPTPEPVRTPEPVPAPAGPLEVQEIEAALAAAGFGAAPAALLVREAGVHSGPFEPSLRHGVRATLAAGIPRPAPLPAAGAAVAFVGPPGSGKTRCVAALAVAYQRRSTLPVSVVSLASHDSGRELKTLLKQHRIRVVATSSGATAAKRIDRARAGAIVILDTPAVGTADPGAVHALADGLAKLALDGVFVTLPATLGARPAQSLLAALAPLAPTGIAVTHLDETDQLGVAVELSCRMRVPIAYLHEGLDLGDSLSAPDPSRLAARVI